MEGTETIQEIREIVAQAIEENLEEIGMRMAMGLERDWEICQSSTGELEVIPGSDLDCLINHTYTMQRLKTDEDFLCFHLGIEPSQMRALENAFAA